MTKPDESVSKFYSGPGWENDNGDTEDALQFEDLRKYASAYVSRCRLRLQDYIPERGGLMLDMASGPIQYKEYLDYSQNFRKRYCVDFSAKALADACEKIGDHGEYFQGDFIGMSFDDDMFDCCISLHTIYHMDKDKQESVVRKLLAAAKSDAPVIVIYSNPRALVSRIGAIKKAIQRFLMSDRNAASNHNQLYFFAHSLDWWKRFSDVAEVRMSPWRSFASHHQKALFPNNRLGRVMLSALFSLENRFPNFFTRYFQYPMIILTKK